MNRFLLLFLTLLTSLFPVQFLTYEFSGGRFGDCVLCYLHAKWLSYKYNRPLLYKPFDYSSQLVLDQLETRYQPYYRDIKLTPRQPFPDSFPKVYTCTYVCPYFPEDPSDRRINPNAYRFDVDWKDPEFRKITTQMIAPTTPLSLPAPPPHTVNIAIHIREGGGYDTDHTRLYDPLKLPPLAFYLEGLAKVLDHFPDRPLYCRVFTDALDPAPLLAQLQKSVPSGTPIQFEARTENNHHTANVLEDFFALFQYDVLIRPQSNYSIVPSLIHDYAIVFSPFDFVRTGRTITITETTLDLNEALYEQVLQRTERP